MIVSINQPAYLPWLGYFHRIAVSDVHVVLNSVQFEKNSFVNRNRIRGKDGPFWLTVPVHSKGHTQTTIADMVIADDAWRRKHAQALRTAYSRAAYFDDLMPYLDAIYERKWDLLAALLSATTELLTHGLGINTQMVDMSELPVTGHKDELVLNICRSLGATVYYSGPFGREYLREDSFRAAGISVRYQDYRHPTYAQRFEGFVPNLSVVDLLLNEGPKAAEILLTGNDSKADIESV